MSDTVVKAILLCGTTIRDQDNRWSMIQVFDRLIAPTLPAQARPFYVYVRLGDAPARGIALIQVEDQSGMALWSTGPTPFDFPDRRGYMDSVLQVPAIVIPRYGTYRVAYYLNSERLADTDLVVWSGVEQVKAC